MFGLVFQILFSAHDSGFSYFSFQRILRIIRLWSPLLSGSSIFVPTSRYYRGLHGKKYIFSVVPGSNNLFLEIFESIIILYDPICSFCTFIEFNLFISYYAAVLLMAVMSQPVLLCGIMSNGPSLLNF